MASIEKYTRTNANKIIRHILRLNKEYQNKDIDKERSSENRVLHAAGFSAYQKRLSDVFCQNRKDVNTLVGVVVTLPKELLVYDRESQYTILKEAAMFFVNRYDPEIVNSVAAAIHADEKGEAPHLHYAFIPVVQDGRRGEKVSAKELVNRKDLQTLHRDLRDYMNYKFGKPIGDYFYTGVTKRNGRNLTVDEIKQLDELHTLQERVQGLESEKEILEAKVEELEDQLKEYEEEYEVKNERNRDFEWEF